MEELLNPPDQQDAYTAFLREQGEGTYVGVKRLEDGSYALMIRLAFTTAIGLGANDHGWDQRFCYDNLLACLDAWQQLTSQHDEPTGWIARRPVD